MIKTLPETLGRYQLLALLATGGMAEIYLARQTGIQGFSRLVVVKRVLPHLARDRSFLEMFFDEARIAAQLNHPNIVQIFDLGNEDEQYFIAMEYLEGESLAYLVAEAQKTGKKIPYEIAAGIVSQICDGLGYAHKLRDENSTPMNIVHRDVNPQNVIVMFSGQVKLVDFGIAKAALQEHHTTVGTLKGKLAYMSPEQCRSQPLSASSDVFSLGALFWELLTHTRLFKRHNEVETINAIIAEEIPPVRRIQPDVPAELEAIVERALNRDPEGRFANASDMGAALRKVVRTRGEEVGKEEIAVFVEKVFGDRARTKHRLLDEIRRSDGGQITFELLKPDTKESIPGGTKTAATTADIPKAAPAAETIIAPNAESISISVNIPRRFPRLLWFLLPGVLVIGLGVWWFLSSQSSKQSESKAPVTDSVASIESSKPKPLEPPPVIEKPTPAVSVVVSADSAPTETSSTATGKDTIPSVPAARADPPKAESSVTTKPSKPPPTQPSVVATGFLQLNTDPYSEVFLAKKSLGLTPLQNVKLPAGTHTLTLINTDQGLKKTVKVTINAGKTSNAYLELK